MDSSDLLIREAGDLRGRGSKLKKVTCRRNIKKSFPERGVEVWNYLKKEVVQVKTISAFEAKLDKSSY